MLKRDYYLKALKSGKFKDKKWVISIFAITGDSKPQPDSLKKIIEDNRHSKNTAPDYKLFRLESGYYFADPAQDKMLTKIEDAVDPAIPLINVKEKISIKANELINCSSDVETNYGNVFFNCTVLTYAFKNKIPFMTGRFSISAVEEKILGKLEDDVESDQELPDRIYVHEYIDFTNAVSYLTGFTQLWLPTATEKALTASPEAIRLRNELFTKFADKLTDPTILAKIDAEIAAADREWMKGDPSEGFLIKKKHYNVVRKKLFYLIGAEEGFDRGATKANPILSSLSEGWDIHRFDTMNTVLRSGSYFRGAETALAGEQVKWLLRVSSNIRIDPSDCGSKLGVVETFTEKSIKKLVGFSVIEGGKSIKVTAENAKSYVNKPVVIRSPMFCHLDKTDYCAVCAGDKLSLHPTGASVAVANYGSEFLSIFLAMMHGKQLEVIDLNLNDVIY